MENSDKGQWFVVNTLSGQENKVKDAIKRQLALETDDLGIYEVLVPTEQVSEVRAGKKTTTTRKFFPGYILIRMNLYNEDNVIRENVWYFVKQIQGVISFVGSGNKPLPLSQHEVDDLMVQVSDKKDKVTPKIDLNIGDTVRIKDGAFENFEGNVEEIDTERGKLKLMVSIFGRFTPVELEFWQVERDT